MINAQANTLNDTGSALLKNNHYMSDDIKNKLDDIKIAGNNLINAFKLRKDKLDKFYNDESTGQQNNTNLKGMANNDRNSRIIITRMKRKNNENNEK